jgi:hypothetical protein
MAWSRMVEYFARFKLSLHISCSLEVLAPTLCRVPIWIHPATSLGKPTNDIIQTDDMLKKGRTKAVPNKNPTVLTHMDPTDNCDEEMWNVINRKDRYSNR